MTSSLPIVLQDFDESLPASPGEKSNHQSTYRVLYYLSTMLKYFSFLHSRLHTWVVCWIVSILNFRRLWYHDMLPLFTQQKTNRVLIANISTAVRSLRQHQSNRFIGWKHFVTSWKVSNQSNSEPWLTMHHPKCMIISGSVQLVTPLWTSSRTCTINQKARFLLDNRNSRETPRCQRCIHHGVSVVADTSTSIRKLFLSSANGFWASVIRSRVHPFTSNSSKSGYETNSSNFAIENTGLSTATKLGSVDTQDQCVPPGENPPRPRH